MPKVEFLPDQGTFEVDENTKLLVAARRNKVDIRFGCASCKCGTCAVAVQGDANLTSMQDNEKALLRKMHLATDGSVRLSCQAKIVQGEVKVDLNFQNTYSPDDFLEEEQ